MSKNLFFLVILMSVMAFSVRSQTVAISGTATIGSYYALGSSTYQAAEYLYYNSEIGNANFISAGTAINKIYFNIYQVGTANNFGSVKILLKSVPNTTISLPPYSGTNSGQYYNTSAIGYTTVFDGILSDATSSGWYEVTLTTPFVRTDSGLSVLIKREDNIDHTGYSYYAAPTTTPNITARYGTGSGNTWMGNTGVVRAAIRFAHVESTTPIDYLDFTAKSLGEDNSLNWTTASEINNMGFYIERSADGKEFSKLGFVSGAGNSTISHSYTYVDKNPLAGYNYYRIKQLDFDGKINYSGIISVKNSEKLSFYIYPNPSSSIIHMLRSSSKNTVVDITNLNGILMKRIIISASSVDINIGFLTSGTYILNVDGVSKLFIKK